MHKTETVDYAIVLHGSMIAILDDCETEMQAGDILIQRGTNHAWSNPLGQPSPNSVRACRWQHDGRVMSSAT